MLEDISNDVDETVQNDNGELQTFVIPVVWQEAGQFVVRARTLKEAIDAIEGNEGDRFGTANANGEYIDDSFEINRDCIHTVSPEELYAYSLDCFIDLSLGKDSVEDDNDDDCVVELSNNGSMEIDKEDGIIRYIDSDGNCQDKWEPGEEGWQRNKDQYFADVELDIEDIDEEVEE